MEASENKEEDGESDEGGRNGEAPADFHMTRSMMSTLPSPPQMMFTAPAPSMIWSPPSGMPIWSSILKTLDWPPTPPLYQDQDQAQVIQGP